MLPKNSVAVVLDFGENIAVKYQNAIKSAHWIKSQITVHPIMCYYFNKVGSLVREALVMLSDDLAHDHHAVHKFKEMAIHHLRTVQCKLMKYMSGLMAALAIISQSNVW